MVFMPFYYDSECVCFAEQQSFDRFKVSDYFSPASLLSSFIVLTANSCHHTRQNAIYLTLLNLDTFTKQRVKKRKRKNKNKEEAGEVNEEEKEKQLQDVGSFSS